MHSWKRAWKTWIADRTLGRRRSMLPGTLRIKAFLLDLGANYWFLPTVMICATILLSFGTIWLDESFSHTLEHWQGITGAVFTRDADGARTILGTIAGSMMTVAVTAFSITIVALQLASTQLGPRVIRSFMKDKGNQATLGVFLSTFMYSLLIQRAVQQGSAEFVPHISVILSLVLAIVSIGVLVYFIHHITDTIQAENVIAVIGRELDQTIDRLFPEQAGSGGGEKRPAVSAPAPDQKPSFTVTSRRDGYLQTVDMDRLMRLAERHDAVLFIRQRPGEFVIRDSILIEGFAPTPPDGGIDRTMHSAFGLGRQRTEAQDVEFAIAQLVQIGSRALSPGINDPFTAMRCVNQLSAALCRLARRRFPSGIRFDDADQPRIVAAALTFEQLIQSAFSQLCTYARTHRPVLIAMLDGLEAIGRFTESTDTRSYLLRHVRHVHQASRSLSQEADRREVQSRCEAVGSNLEL